MKYKCLIFDHDDTVVNSTATIHHPCFQKYLDIYYPGKKCDLETYFIKNFSPGFIEMCREDYGMTEQDLIEETKFWSNYVKDHIPTAYCGIREIMEKQKQAGGLIAVISHSMKNNILRDYKENLLPEPDIIFGWDEPQEHRKPNPWPVEQIIEKYKLNKTDILMIDDLKPGYDMAISAGINFAAAGWANNIKIIEDFMRSNCRNYFKSVESLKNYLLENNE